MTSRVEQFSELRDRLSEYVTEARRQRMRDVLARRTRHLTVVLEDVYQAHNISACLRSCEAFGVQDVHVIEHQNRFSVIKDISLGTGQWLSIFRYRTDNAGHGTTQCLSKLKARGYRIVAASPCGTPVTEIALGAPIALVFGTEITGLSDVATAACDEFVSIPMAGFVESLNLSVACAICVHTLTSSLRSRREWPGLSEAERLALEVDWMRMTVEKHWHGLPDRIEEEIGR